MYETYLAQIDRAIEESKNSLVHDLSRLIELKSIYEVPSTEAPFGVGPLRMLNVAADMGEKDGLYLQDYHVGVISLALQEGQPDLGIWCYGDVERPRSGWTSSPFDVLQKQDDIIGCGARNNKGPLCAIFHLLKIFKKLGIPLNYNPALYIGSDQQNGMRDMTGIFGRTDAQGFCNICIPPRLSLVPDGHFPVGYGGKGVLIIKFRGNKALRNLTIAAGQPDFPGTAEAILQGESIIFRSPVRHASNPEPYGNMISQLMEELLRRPETALENRLILEFFKLISKDVYGKRLCIDAEHKEMGSLTIFAKEINTVSGYPDLTVQIHYPIGMTYGEIVRTLAEAAEKYDVSIVDAHNIAKPFLVSKESKTIRRLTSLANQVNRAENEPYTLSKATYANLLPNALVYGMDDRSKTDTAYGVDESISIDQLLKGMKIYARALLSLNEMEWE